MTKRRETYPEPGSVPCSGPSFVDRGRSSECSRGSTSPLPSRISVHAIRAEPKREASTEASAPTWRHARTASATLDRGSCHHPRVAASRSRGRARYPSGFRLSPNPRVASVVTGRRDAAGRHGRSPLSEARHGFSWRHSRWDDMRSTRPLTRAEFSTILWPELPELADQSHHRG